MSRLSDQELRALAFLMSRRRPAHAEPWDEAGIVAKLRQVEHIDGEEVIYAGVRAAANPENVTPGVIPLMGAEHWQQPGPPAEPIPEPVDPSTLCAHCGQVERLCWRNPHSGHTYESAADYDERVERDRARRAGVDPDTGELTLTTTETGEIPTTERKSA